MEDYLQYKPGHLKVAHTKNKYGIGQKTGATLRRNCYTERQGSSHRNNSLILKHVSLVEKWSPHQVEDDVILDDGDLQAHGCHQRRQKRGKTARSAVAKQLPKVNNFENAPSSGVTYSLNKKKRWLLPTAIKEEIDHQKILDSRYGAADVTLSLVVRELSQQSRRLHRPDTVAVATTSRQDKENFPKTKHRKSKRKTYSFSTDLLGLSQDGNNREETPKLDTINPEVTYEICKPRMRGPYSINPLKESTPAKQEKERRPKRGKKSHYHGEDALQHYRARKSHSAVANDLM